jgi:ribosomal protein S18 acetylase RimI-like enzyme
MVIRPARLEDAPAMGRVMVDTWFAAHRDQVPAAALQERLENWTAQDSQRAWEENLIEMAAEDQPDRCLYVALAESGQVVGIAMGGPAKDETTEPTGEVYVLYVLPEHQSRGHGQRLIRAVAAHLARLGNRALHIGCLGANAAARRFYEKLGGHIIGQREGGEDGVEVVYGWPDISLLNPTDKAKR